MVDSAKDERASEEARMMRDSLEGKADAWAARINLNWVIETIMSPMLLDRGAPDHTLDSVAKRAKEYTDAIVRAAFVQGAIETMDGVQARALLSQLQNKPHLRIPPAPDSAGEAPNVTG